MKDNWKVNSNLTVNLGLRYDWFGVPYLDQGLAGRPAGGQAGLFGISGTNFANAMWNPNATGGSLTTAQFVGPNSPNPKLGVYNNYWKDLGPSIGIAWNIPVVQKKHRLPRRIRNQLHRQCGLPDRQHRSWQLPGPDSEHELCASGFPERLAA